MYLFIDKAKYGHNTLYVHKSFRKDNGKTSTKVVERLGTLEELSIQHSDVIDWAKKYIAELNKKEKENKTVLLSYETDKLIEKDETVLFEGGYLFLEKIFHQLKIDKICKKISENYDFKYSLSEILSVLIYGRVLFPKSKLGTFENSKTMLEKPNFEIQDVYRSLEVIAKEKDLLQSEIYKASLDMGKRNDKILYYDCTNYYFEIESESGLRKYGISKEHRPNPIVQMGLFMDGDGMPLAFNLNSGNTSEQKTLIPLEEQIINDFGNAKFVVCTDAGLSSIANRKFNDINNRAFITVQSIKKMKDFQKKWALSPEGWRLPGHSELFNLDSILSSEELCEKYRLFTFYKEEWWCENDIDQRYIITFSIKYMNYQRKIRIEQIERAKKAIVSTVKSEKTRQTDYKRFIMKIPVTNGGEIATKKLYALNEEKQAYEESFDGFYCVSTNLEDSATEIIRINQKRWEIEESFRIMKTEFKARPVFLSRDDRITAHFTICFLALLIFRKLENMLSHKYTATTILDGLKSMKFHKTNEGYIPLYPRTDFTDDLHNLFGFRTDYQILTNSNIKNIFKLTKKSFT